MTDGSDKAQRTTGAVSSAELTASSAPEAPEQGGAPAARRADSEGSGLRRVTLTKDDFSEEGGPEPSDPDSVSKPGDGRLEPPAADPYIGCTIDGRYQVETILGEGGMGVVYRCTHSIIGKKVAMKVLRADLARNEEVTERFLNEAKSASSIGSPHIIDISDFGRLPDNSTYFVMEYLEGQTLANVVDRQGPVPIERLVHIAEQLADGLYAAHEAGIIHRDLKPDNIFLVPRDGRDFVKILDFGIAKAATTEGKLTQAGQVFGTPHYMSPEQAAGTPIDHRADIYSLGVILYEMASGRLPFDAENFMGILTQHMYKAPAPISSLVPPPQDVPAGLEAIILKCLSKIPDQRYATMRELGDDLRRFREGHIPQAIADLIGSRKGLPELLTGKPLRSVPTVVGSRRPVYAAVGVGAVALVGVGAWLSRGPSDDSARPPLVEAQGPVEPSASLPREAAATKAPPTPAPERPSSQPEQVLVAVAPLDARVYRNDEDLGTSPIVIEVPPGQTVRLVAKKEGYKDAHVELDGSQSKLSIALERIAPAPRAASKPGKPATSQPKPRSPSSSGIINPWE